MGLILLYVFVAGSIGVTLGIILQILGSIAFSHFKSHDTKELAGLSGLRVSAIFGIAAGLIFSSTHTHYVQANSDVLQEVRLIGTMYIVTSDVPSFPNSKIIRSSLLKYAKILASDLEKPAMADQSAETGNNLLFEICKSVSPTDLEMTPSMVWLRNELESSCNKLIELRGKERIGMKTSNVEAPFWIFFVVSFVFLSFLLGVFEKNILNLIFAALFYFAAGVTAILIYWMANPYHGPSRITSQPLTQLIVKMHSLDKDKR